MIISTIRRYWKKGWFSFLISLLSFLYLLKLSWLKWGDLIIDSGRELSVPLKLASGAVLYRDIYYLYGPFSPYCNALLYKLFGVSIYSILISGIFTACLTSVLVYKLSRFFLPVISALLTTLTFLFVFAFGHYVVLGNYNFILPYSYSAIHGIAFSLAAFYLYLRALKSPHSRYRLFLGACVLFACICRIEIGVALFISLAAGELIYAVCKKTGWRELLVSASYTLILPGVSAALVYGFFWLGAGNLAVTKDVFLSNIKVQSVFTAWLAGIVNLKDNLLTMLKTCLMYAILLALFFSSGLLAAQITRLPKTILRRSAYFSLAGLAALAAYLVLERYFYFGLQYRCLPIIYFVTICLGFWRLMRARQREEQIFLVTLSLFSFLMALRILFSAWAGHYGFYILVPGIIVYYIFFLRLLPEAARTMMIKRFICLGFSFVFCWFIYKHHMLSRYAYGQRTLSILSARGKLLVFDNDIGARSKHLLEYLEKNTNPNDAVVFFPEGLGINFFSARDNPLYFYNYLPLELAPVGAEDLVIRQMEEKKIKYAVILGRDTREYGFSGFGLDYAFKLRAFIEQSYTLEKQFGDFPYASGRFGIAVYKRNAP